MLQIIEPSLVSLGALILFVYGYYSISRLKLDRSDRSCKVPDDDFDIGIINIFGLVLIILCLITAYIQYGNLYIDELLLEMAIGITAFYVQDNVNAGIFFTSLAYCSWYGCYKIVMNGSIDTNSILTNTRLLAAIVAFSSTTLVSSLKYPVLMRRSGSSVAHSLLGLSMLLFFNTSFLPSLYLCNYHGISLAPYDRWLGAAPLPKALDDVSPFNVLDAIIMVCLQIVSFFFTHWQTTEISKRLKEQEDIPVGDEGDSGNDSGRSGDFSRFMAYDENNKDYTDLQDIPDDCVEISAEEACELQERSYETARNHQQSSISGSASAEADGVRQRHAGNSNLR
mmetsp:Transcript_10201/g.16742  ORF Transcript_10201/g.16742 Transcript_10201/m.16742 type:complete len:339 (+) Transcript_10201:32-1048(+)